MRMPEVTIPHLFQLNGINFVLTALHYSFFFICNRVLLGSPGSPETFCVDQVSLELTEVRHRER